MDKELLKEFKIKEYGNDYAIYATDDAYKLLGLERKTQILSNGYIKDSIDIKYYRKALLIFLRNTYCIDGLVRTSRGNNHDASWESEVYIFKEGFYTHELNNLYRNKKTDLYTASPVVLEKDKITDEIIDDWVNEYDLSGNGEDDRMVFCSYSDGSNHFCFSFDDCKDVGDALSGKKHVKISTGSREYLKCKIIGR